MHRDKASGRLESDVDMAQCWVVMESTGRLLWGWDRVDKGSGFVQASTLQTIGVTGTSFFGHQTKGLDVDLCARPAHLVRIYWYSVPVVCERAF